MLPWDTEYKMIRTKKWRMVCSAVGEKEVHLFQFSACDRSHVHPLVKRNVSVCRGISRKLNSPSLQGVRQLSYNARRLDRKSGSGRVSLTSGGLCSPQSRMEQCLCRERFLGIAAPTARLKPSPCDCRDPWAASLQDAFWRGPVTKWDRSYEMSAEGTKLRIQDWLLLGKDQRRWKQQRLVALFLFLHKCDHYFSFTQWAKVYRALYPGCATFLCLILICCNLCLSVTLKYYRMFCLLPCCISKAWLSSLY